MAPDARRSGPRTSARIGYPRPSWTGPAMRAFGPTFSVGSRLAEMAEPALPPFLTARGVSKRFGALTALSGVDLEIRRGEVLALLGDNGAGKSTFVKILAGAHAMSGGEIRIEDQPVAFASPQDAAPCGIATI